MRKSFKKVLCAVMAASMVFSTPIATNVVAQAASGEEGVCVVKDLTKTTELTDTVANGAWWTNFSDYYRFEGNFDCTLELTSKTSGTNNWNAPSVVLTTDADRLASGYKEYVAVRADNYGWGDNYDATLATTDSTDWASWLEIAKDCKATIQVKRSGDTVYVNETYTSSTDDSKVRHQSYTVKNVSADKIRFFLAGDNNEMAITKAVVPDYTVKAKAKLDLVTNGDSKASVEASVLNNGVTVPDAAVTYKTSDEKVATVDDKGEVTAVADGNAVITATYAYGEDQTVTADTEVTVTTTAEKVTISGEGVAEGKGTLNILKDKKNGSVAPGKVALTATVTPENAAVKEEKPSAAEKKEKGKTVPAVPEAARAYLLDTTSFTPEWSGSTLWMLPEPVRDVYPLLREHLRILSAGICMGEAKGKDFIPAEELALSTGLRREAFPTVDLDWEDAIRYLKKEALLLPDSTEKGYVLICHKGFPLAFAKHLGNRANNLYPQEWRIRTGYVPEKVKTFEMKVQGRDGRL